MKLKKTFEKRKTHRGCLTHSFTHTHTHTGLTRICIIYLYEFIHVHQNVLLFPKGYVFSYFLVVLCLCIFSSSLPRIRVAVVVLLVSPHREPLMGLSWPSRAPIDAIWTGKSQRVWEMRVWVYKWIYRGRSRGGDPVNLSRWMHLTAPFRFSSSSRVKKPFDIYSASNEVRWRRKNPDKIDDVRSSLFIYFFPPLLFSPFLQFGVTRNTKEGNFLITSSFEVHFPFLFQNLLFLFRRFSTSLSKSSELPPSQSFQLNEIKDILKRQELKIFLK